ncbi:MAG: heparinase II/III domain-containing protein [Limisphaerales bacterium]
MSNPLGWYWHRLRAMDVPELVLHAQKKFFQFADARRPRDWRVATLQSSNEFPILPDRAQAPEVLRAGLKRDVENILAGRWKAFGHLELKVDDPPRWQCDYLAGKDLATAAPAFDLNHRELPAGADIKLIWELSRWYQPARLAMAAYVLDDERSARKCAAWLSDWAARNPPFRGWNWTSALEAGIRLVQFTWIDALLEKIEAAPHRSGPEQPAAEGNAEASAALDLQTLRHRIVPAHVWFTWRYKSFGSSANNHLLGELAGLILATARWPAVARWGASLDELQRRWEREVLEQFAEDGGNREQALNYHLFSWEFCWQARAALTATGRKISFEVEDRLARAARFFWEVQARQEPWDYGDSDNAFVTPFFAREETAVREWRDWIGRLTGSPSLLYWLGEPPAERRPIGFGEPLHALAAKDWWVYPKTGIGTCELGSWWLRWDLSPLGYLRTAAHGHADALHLSIWFRGTAMVIDPGTGAYYADARLRAWFASRAAHNGPCPEGEEHPKRLGPFLWAAPHERPEWSLMKASERSRAGLLGTLRLPNGVLRRGIARVEYGDGWEVMDGFDARPGCPKNFTVRWQFAPETSVKLLGERRFLLRRRDASVVVEVGAEWADITLVEAESERRDVASMDGAVSPAFRKVCFAPYLLLRARPGEKPCLFRTTFLASTAS